MKQLRVGLIGAGSVAWFAHLPAIDVSESFTLAALSSRSQETANRAKERWGAEAAYHDMEDLLAHPDLDVIVIASPNAAHFGQARRALESGLHVLIDKPMSSTNGQAQQLVKLADQRGLAIAVGCHQRYWAQHRQARELIDAGAIGTVRMIRTSLHESWTLYQQNVAHSDFRMSPREAVAGTTFDQGTHRVDLLNFLAGSRPERVVGVVANGVNPDLSPLIDDLAVGIVTYANGIEAVITLDKFSPAVSNITEIYGTEGTIFVSSETINPYQSVPLAIFSSRRYTKESIPAVMRQYRYPGAFWVSDFVSEFLPPQWTSVVPPRNEPFRDLYEDFATRIRGGQSAILPSNEQAASVMEVVCGLMLSSQTRSWVDLPMTEDFTPPGLR
jgi:predicted dehydrogenase